jgi:hypothetical protein
MTAGVAREVGEVALPDSLRQTQLYQNLVDATLRFLIQQVGEVEGVYTAREKLPDDFLARRTAGNVIEVLGVVAFRASPVWVLAALADVCGAGRRLIPEIAAALRADGLLDEGTEFTSMDQLLDGLERTSSRLASSINTPPLDVAALREEWKALRDDARTLPAATLPSPEAISTAWGQIQGASARQGRSVFEMSTLMAMAAARAGVTRTGQILGTAMLDHYRATLHDIERTGFASYASDHLRPYLRAAAAQFAPGRQTLTERLIERFRKRKQPED